VNRNVLFFDLDGTLTDPREGFVRCITRGMRAAGGEPPSSAVIASLIGPPLHHALAVLLGTQDESILRTAVAAYRSEYEAGGIYGTHLYPGIHDVITVLRSHGGHLHVVTAKPTVYACRILEHLGLADSFGSIHGPDLTELRCTKTELLGRALGAARCRGDCATMIGDRAEDVLAARHHGALAIGAGWGYGSYDELHDAGAQFVASSPAELRAILTSPG
jgi:phosphoglycolate phosphatase